MRENTRFYICKNCGNQVGLIKDYGNIIECCGDEMELMEANTTDSSTEKHVPVYEKDELENQIVVKVGANEHPMEKDHYIMWIAQVSDNRTTRVRLFPEQDTVVRLEYIKGATLYAYCNKHGLWSTKVD